MYSSLFYNYIQDIRGPFDQLDHISILRKTVVAHRTTCKLHLRVTIWYQKLQNRVYVWGALLNFFLHPENWEEEEQKMRRIFVTDIFRARAQKRSCLMWHSLSALLLACSHILFFCPKNLNFTYHTSLFIHFQKVWQPILWRGKGLQPLPQSASPILGHVP